MGFSPLRRIELTAATCPGLPHPVRALPGFLTLVAPYSAVASRVYFAPVAPMGFSPSERSPCTKRGNPSREPIALLPLADSRTRRPGFRALRQVQSRYRASLFKTPRGTCSHGLHLFRASTSPVQSFRKEGIRSWAYIRSAHCPDPQRPSACFHAGESA